MYSMGFSLLEAESGAGCSLCQRLDDVGFEVSRPVGGWPAGTAMATEPERPLEVAEFDATATGGALAAG